MSKRKSSRPHDAEVQKLKDHGQENASGGVPGDAQFRDPDDRAEWEGKPKGTELDSHGNASNMVDPLDKRAQPVKVGPGQTPGPAQTQRNHGSSAMPQVEPTDPSDRALENRGDSTMLQSDGRNHPIPMDAGTKVNPLPNGSKVVISPVAEPVVAASPTAADASTLAPDRARETDESQLPGVIHNPRDPKQHQAFGPMDQGQPPTQVQATGSTGIPPALNTDGSAKQ